MNLKYLGTYIVACISLFLFSCGNSKNENQRNAFPITDTVAKDINPAIPQPVNLLDANCIWSIAYGGKKADNPHDIVSTADSGCIVLLWRTKNITKVDEVSEKREWQIVRFDKYGTIVWDKTLPTNEFGDYYTSIALFNEMLLLHSYSEDSSYLTSCNLSNGEILNKSSIKQCKSLFIHVSKINKIYVIGYGKNSPFISEISQDGENKSEIFFEGEQWNKIKSVIDDTLGNIYFTGRSGKFNSEGLWLGAIDKNCSLLWSKSNILPDEYYCGNTIFLTSDNSLLVAGSYWEKDIRRFNLFTAKFNLAGINNWTSVTEGDNNDCRRGTIEYNGSYYILANIESKNQGGEARVFCFTSGGQKQNSMQLNNFRGLYISKSNTGNSFFVLGDAWGFQVNGPGDGDVYLLSGDFTGRVNKNTRSYNIDNSNDDNGINLNNLNTVENYIKLYRFDRYENGYSFNLLFNPKDEISGEMLFSTHVIPKNGTPQFVSQNVYTYEIDSNIENGRLYFKTSLGEKSIYLTNDGDFIMHDDERNQTYYFGHSVR